MTDQPNKVKSRVKPNYSRMKGRYITLYSQINGGQTGPVLKINAYNENMHVGRAREVLCKDREKYSY